MPHVEQLGLLTLVFLLLSVGWSATNTNPISTTIMAWFPNGQRELSIALIGASFGGSSSPCWVGPTIDTGSRWR